MPKGMLLIPNGLSTRISTGNVKADIFGTWRELGENLEIT
jgi:hypothetical protein